MAKRRIEPLTEGERNWVAVELANARRLVGELNPSDAGSALTPEILDRVYKAARSVVRSDSEAANGLINAVGIAFGQYLVDQLGFGWVAVFDDEGVEIGVIALPGTADMLVFPPNLVAKRWDEGAVDFLVSVLNGIEGDLQTFQSHWSEHPAKKPTDGQASQDKRSWIRRLFNW